MVVVNSNDHLHSNSSLTAFMKMKLEILWGAWLLWSPIRWPGRVYVHHYVHTVMSVYVLECIIMCLYLPICLSVWCLQAIPRAFLETIPSAGHVPQQETAAEFNYLIHQFLTRWRHLLRWHFPRNLHCLVLDLHPPLFRPTPPYECWCGLFINSHWIWLALAFMLLIVFTPVVSSI